MKSKENLTKLMVGAIGVVFGDIGTSPLYALKSCFFIANLPITAPNVLGVVSLFIWSLFLVTSLKYIHLVLRVQNQGEGGILVLSSLCANLLRHKKTIPLWMGIVGTALFFGDGIITPAISVLSALEGGQLLMPFSKREIMCGSIILLILLFSIQKRGSGKIGAYFGPIMVVWFLTLGALGVYHIAQNTSILYALAPTNLWHFFINNRTLSFTVLGASILVITGAEALYADLGHFGKRSIHYSWNLCVFPCLVLNYLGQGALILKNPGALSNVFFNMAPLPLLTPLVILSTLATIIASQAIISGIFSLTWQAIMLNYLPRMRIIHTSTYKGQVYAPTINWLLCALTIGAVLKFQSSENLAAAYGLSVACVMLITTTLVFYVAYQEWRWSIYRLFVFFVPFIFLDITFVITNIVKFFDGAWYTVFVTSCVSYVIYVWRKGSRTLKNQKFPHHKNIMDFINNYQKKKPFRIPGCAIFMSRSASEVPNTLVLNLHHNKFLHEKLIFLSIITEESPRFYGDKKFQADEIAKGVFVIQARFGFQEIPNISKITTWAHEKGIIENTDSISCFLSRGVAVPSHKRIFGKFGEKLYIFLSKNAQSAHEFFKIPHSEVIELGIYYKI
jgi:KUP system potassium uptake protein